MLICIFGFHKLRWYSVTEDTRYNRLDGMCQRRTISNTSDVVLTLSVPSWIYERGNKWAYVLVIVDGQPWYRISGARHLVQSLLSAPHCANLYKAVEPYIPTDTILINSPCVSREAIGGGFKLLTCMCAFCHGWRSSISWAAQKLDLILAVSLLSFKLVLASIVVKVLLMILQANQPVGLKH